MNIDQEQELIRRIRSGKIEWADRLYRGRICTCRQCRHHIRNKVLLHTGRMTHGMEIGQWYICKRPAINEYVACVAIQSERSIELVEELMAVEKLEDLE